jgi:hypothetical protein
MNSLNTAKANSTRGHSTPSGRAASKLDQLTILLLREGGATLAELKQATGWQAHSVRGALAGALKRRGLAISSTKVGGVRTYSAKAVQA